jgi:hypothetical protein
VVYGNCICTGLEAAKSGGKDTRAADKKVQKPFLRHTLGICQTLATKNSHSGGVSSENKAFTQIFQGS